MSDGDAARVWSWAATDDDVAERRAHVEGLVGHRVRAVRYYTLDYLRWELHPELTGAGARLVADESEWEHPTWQFDGFDAFDYGFELLTESGSAWSLTWDPPGNQEGIGLRNQPMLGSAVTPEADVAVWDVSRTATWVPFLREPVEAVELHYAAWGVEGSGSWCPHISLHSRGTQLEVILGDSDRGSLVPSADNVAVLWPSTPLPDWLARNP
jgi:hypothetical protein